MKHCHISMTILSLTLCVFLISLLPLTMSTEMPYPFPTQERSETKNYLTSLLQSAAYETSKIGPAPIDTVGYNYEKRRAISPTRSVHRVYKTRTRHVKVIRLVRVRRRKGPRTRSFSSNSIKKKSSSEWLGPESKHTSNTNGRTLGRRDHSSWKHRAPSSSFLFRVGKGIETSSTSGSKTSKMKSGVICSKNIIPKSAKKENNMSNHDTWKSLDKEFPVIVPEFSSEEAFLDSNITFRTRTEQRSFLSNANIKHYVLLNFDVIMRNVSVDGNLVNRMTSCMSNEINGETREAVALQSANKFTHELVQLEFSMDVPFLLANDISNRVTDIKKLKMCLRLPQGADIYPGRQPVLLDYINDSSIEVNRHAWENPILMSDNVNQYSVIRMFTRSVIIVPCIVIWDVCFCLYIFRNLLADIDFTIGILRARAGRRRKGQQIKAVQQQRKRSIEEVLISDV